MMRAALLWLMAVAAMAVPAQADAVSDWIAAQPERFRFVLEAGQSERKFKALKGTCPANVFPVIGRYGSGNRDCSQRPDWCLVQCRAGSGNACFGLARSIELDLEDTHEGTFKFPFFMAACRAGNANGCTNAGATAKNGSWLPSTHPHNVSERSCQFRTYDAACSAGAPWGCFMLGLEWGIEGVDGVTNREKAVAAWQKSCDLDPDGSACDSATLRLERFAE